MGTAHPDCVITPCWVEVPHSCFEQQLQNRSLFVLCTVTVAASVVSDIPIGLSLRSSSSLVNSTFKMYCDCHLSHFLSDTLTPCLLVKRAEYWVYVTHPSDSTLAPFQTLPRELSKWWHLQNILIIAQKNSRSPSTAWLFASPLVCYALTVFFFTLTCESISLYCRVILQFENTSMYWVLVLHWN